MGAVAGSVGSSVGAVTSSSLELSCPAGPGPGLAATASSIRRLLSPTAPVQRHAGARPLLHDHEPLATVDAQDADRNVRPVAGLAIDRDPAGGAAISRGRSQR